MPTDCSVCTVNKGDGQSLQIVCGAPNARAGLKTVLAPVGAWIPGSDMTPQRGKIRGETSQGMLCSYAELALGEDLTVLSSLRQMHRQGQILLTMQQNQVKPDRPCD